MLKLVSYNIHGGKDYLWRNRLKEMAETLRMLDADVIALQEVHQNSRHGFQADFLAQALGYRFAFAPVLPLANGAYGLALLTRFPILQSHMTMLPARRESRALLQTRLKHGETVIEAWVTHLSLDRTSREAQLRSLAERARALSCPLILMGDFNTGNPALPPCLRDCAREKQRHYLSTLLTFPRRVDHVFISPQWQLDDYHVIDVRWSDHFPLFVILQLPKQPAPAE